MTLKNRLALAAADLPRGWQAGLARRCGVKPPSVADWVSGATKKLEGENLLSAAEYLGVRPQWLATGSGRMRETKPESATVLTLSENLMHQGSYLMHTVLPSIAVPLLNAKASMGDGELLPSDEVVLGNLPISGAWAKRWLSSQTSPDALRFFHGVGDSMEPTFSHGAILLADTGVREVKSDGIYVLEANEMLYVKRVRRRMDGSYEVSSDNPTVKTVDVLDGTRPVSILGQVLWLWNGRKV